MNGKTRLVCLSFAAIACFGAACVFGAEPDQNSDLDARLEAARVRLEQAAHEVAELSARLSAPVIDQLMPLEAAGGRSLIGAQLEPVQDGKGARIREVSPGGAAAEAGLQAGDVITAIDGTDVKSDETTQHIAHRLRDLAPDRKTKLRVARNGKSQELEVTTRAAPRNALAFLSAPGESAFLSSPPGMPALPALPAIPGIPSIPDPPEPFSDERALRSGLGDMELVSLTPKLGQYFGADKGVLVVRAPKSAAFKLEEGDVIRSIDGRAPDSGAHVLRILRSYEPGEKIHLKVLRKRKDLDFEVTLPKAAADPALRERRIRIRERDDDLPD